MRGRGKFGYQLQPLNVDRLDTTLNRAPSAAQNAILMGVEVDSARMPMAYHIWTADVSAGSVARRERERVPADDILHGFVGQEEEQTRGVPWLHAPCASSTTSRATAKRPSSPPGWRFKMGMYVAPDGVPPNGEEGSDGNFTTDATPGQFDVAPPGYDFKTYDPTYPARPVRCVLQNLARHRQRRRRGLYLARQRPDRRQLLIDPLRRAR